MKDSEFDLTELQNLHLEQEVEVVGIQTLVEEGEEVGHLPLEGKVGEEGHLVLEGEVGEGHLEFQEEEVEAVRLHMAT